MWSGALDTKQPRNLILTGFMGTGKTTAGRLAAARLGMRFVDSDIELVKLAGRTITEIFEQDGEAAFRELEAHVVLDLAIARGNVIALGGGALMNPDTRAAIMADNLVVCLTASLETIEARLTSGHSTRPLASNWRGLYEQRREVYESFAHRIDTTHMSPTQTAEELSRLWRSASSQ